MPNQLVGSRAVRGWGLIVPMSFACVGDYGPLPTASEQDEAPGLGPSADAGGADASIGPQQGDAAGGAAAGAAGGGSSSWGLDGASSAPSSSGGGAGAGTAVLGDDAVLSMADADAPVVPSAPPVVPCGVAGGPCCAVRACPAGLTCASTADAVAAGTCRPCASLMALGFADATLAERTSSAAAISADGLTIVGSSVQLTNAPPLSAEVAVRWRNEQLEVIGAPGEDNVERSSSRGVSSDGSVLVMDSWRGAPDNSAEPFVWRTAQPNKVQRLSRSNASPSNLAFGISDDGNVVVGMEQVLGAAGDGSSAGCFWTLSPDGNGYTSTRTTPSFGAVGAYDANADGSLIVGGLNTDETGGGSAFLWNEVTRTLVRLPPLGTNAGATAHAINAFGTVVVGGEDGGGGPLLWRVEDPYTPQPLDPEGLVGGVALGTSADGSVVVGGDPNAFVWTAAAGIRLVTDVLSAAGVSTSHWQYLERATGVSADGRIIVGDGIRAEDGLREGFRATLGPDACAPL